MKNNENYILSIYSQKSITRAASVIGISQPALSSSLSSLENKLGFEIFDRSTNPLTTTNEGDAYIEYLYQKKELELGLKNKISDIRAQKNLSISIGAPSAYVETRLLPALSEFISTDSYVNFSLTEGTVPFLEQEMLNGNLDLFLSTTQNLCADFFYEPLGEEKPFLCVPANSKFATFDEIDICDLQNEKFIFLHKEQPLQQLVDKYLLTNNIALSHNIRVDQISSAIKLVKLGHGVCFVTNNSINPGIDNEIKLLPLTDYSLSRNLYAVTPKKRFITNQHKRFLEILKAQQERMN